MEFGLILKAVSEELNAAKPEKDKSWNMPRLLGKGGQAVGYAQTALEIYE